MKEKKSEAPRRGNEELFKWDGNPTFGQILPLAAQHVLAAVVGCVTPAILVANAANNAGGNVNMGLLIQMSLVFAALSTFLQHRCKFCLCSDNDSNCSTGSGR